VAPQENGAPSDAVPYDDVALRRAAWRRVPNRLFAFLLSADFFFVALFAVAVALGFTHGKSFLLVNLDIETNPPSWYAATKVFGIAVAYLLLGTRLLPMRRRAADLRRLWLTLGVAFTLLSMDEGAQLHERMGHFLKRLHFNLAIDGGGRWVFFYLVIALTGAFLLRKEILLAWRYWRTEMLLSAAGLGVLAVGAVGIEAVGWWVERRGLARFIGIGVEEGLELVGMTIMAYAAYRILAYVLSSEPDTDPEIMP
jgi:hypothetical protein